MLWLSPAFASRHSVDAVYRWLLHLVSAPLAAAMGKHEKCKSLCPCLKTVFSVYTLKMKHSIDQLLGCAWGTISITSPGFPAPAVKCPIVMVLALLVPEPRGF